MTQNEKSCCIYEAEFEKIWPHIMREWNEDGEDAFWLIAHASYLFRTGSARWGVDLTLRTNAMLDCIQSHDLSSLSFVLTTHFHGDHFSPRFCEQLAQNDTVWVLPDFMPETLRENALRNGIKAVFVHEGDEISLAGNLIRVLPGHHYDDGGTYGVPSYAYAVKTADKLLYFPGDVRDYRAHRTSDCTGADALFAHVWLGRGRAELPLEDTFLIPYCDFLANAQARNVYFAHLNDYSRNPAERWTERHAQAVAKELHMRQPDVHTVIPRIGEKQIL